MNQGDLIVYSRCCVVRISAEKPLKPFYCTVFVNLEAHEHTVTAGLSWPMQSAPFPRDRHSVEQSHLKTIDSRTPAESESVLCGCDADDCPPESAVGPTEAGGGRAEEEAGLDCLIRFVLFHL